MPLGPRDLVLCAGTLARVSLPDRVQAASAAGFAGISAFVTDLEQARAEGWSATDLRALLADRGLAVAELDPLLRWIPGTQPAGLDAWGAVLYRQGLDDALRAADALAARSLNLVCVADPPPPPDRVAEAFAHVCDRAAGHGLLVHLEFLPWTTIPDARTACAIVERAGRSNGGILLDAWHHFRSGLDDAALRALPGARVLAVQLSDAPRRAEADLVEETLHRRLLPGAGEADLTGLLRILDAIGSPAPLGVEVFSDALAAEPPAAVAVRAAGSLRELLARTRNGAAGR